METHRQNPPASPAPPNLALILFRSLRSSLIIAAVALFAAGLRAGRLNWRDAWDLLAQNRAVFALIFFAVLVWEYWFRRVRDRHRSR